MRQRNPDTLSHPLQIRFKPDIRHKIEAMAKIEKHRNLSRIVREIVERHFNGAPRAS